MNFRYKLLAHQCGYQWSLLCFVPTKAESTSVLCLKMSAFLPIGLWRMSFLTSVRRLSLQKCGRMKRMKGLFSKCLQSSSLSRLLWLRFASSTCLQDRSSCLCIDMVSASHRMKFKLLSATLGMNPSLLLISLSFYTPSALGLNSFHHEYSCLSLLNKASI